VRVVIAPTASCQTIPVTLDERQLRKPIPEADQESRVAGQPGAGKDHPRRSAGPARPSGRPRDPSYAPGGHRRGVRGLRVIFGVPRHRRAARESVPCGGIPAPFLLAGGARAAGSVDAHPASPGRDHLARGRASAWSRAWPVLR